MPKHALPTKPYKAGKHAGSYNVVLEILALTKELQRLLRSMK